MQVTKPDTNSSLTHASVAADDALPMEVIVEAAYDSAAPSEKAQLLAQLVGKIYEEAPAPEKRLLVAHLMRPIGLLSLLAVAGGIFAKIRFRGGWPDVQVRAEDVGSIDSSAVTALASYAQQVSAHVLDGLVQAMTASPVLAGTMTVMVLIQLLNRRQSPPASLS